MYRGKYVRARTIYWGDSKLKGFIQQFATVIEGLFCLTVVGTILIAIICAVCVMIGGVK